MDEFIIDGGVPLRGTITPSGNKNAAFPLIAAALLTTPSTCIQLSKLGGPTRFDPGPPGFRVVDVEDGRLSSYVVYVG